MANTVTIKQLLEAGAHFGHQTTRWHPKMKRYIFTQRNGIHIIDLEQTAALMEKACAFMRELVASGQDLLFVGTKKQAQEAVAEEAKRCGMPYVNLRWLGGMLTNFQVIQTRIDHLVFLEEQQTRGEFQRLPKKENLKLMKEIGRLNKQMGSFKEMTKLPGALFIIDPTRERTALMEAKRKAIPVVAIVDTNCNPDEIDYPIPANDDAIRALKLVCNRVAEAVLEGKNIATIKAAEAKEDEEMAEAGVKAGEGTQSYSFAPDEN
ncbi:MAG: ribosomal protein [Dehalococcoidia bacterium]|nr:ribosomal protein [Dehalococcoidia bacterium]